MVFCLLVFIKTWKKKLWHGLCRGRHLSPSKTGDVENSNPSDEAATTPWFFFRISHGEYANKKIRQPDENAYMKAYLFQRATSLVFQYEDSEQLTGPTVGCQAALNTGAEEGGW